MVQKKGEVKLRPCALYIIRHFNTSEVHEGEKEKKNTYNGIMEWTVCSCNACTVRDARLFIPLFLFSFYIQLIIIFHLPNLSRFI